MHKKYLKRSLILFLLIIFTIASINFIIDPGEIYLKKILATYKSAKFSNQLFNSKNGIIQQGWNERLIKTTLAKASSDFDCIILGSSHIVQISSVRNTGNIRKQCPKLLNLGVSGASLEDISIFSYLVLNNTKLPKKVFINITPWTLKFGMDNRYGIYKKYYNEMNILLEEVDIHHTISYESQLIKNLFNGEYLQYSLKELFEQTKRENDINNLFTKEIRFPLKPFSYTTGYKESILLKDGSHVYSKKWIETQKSKNASLTMGDGSYKINNNIYDKSALKYLIKIIKTYQDNGVEVALILTPYHPNIFKKGDTKPVKHFKKVEAITIRVGLDHNLTVYGSFFPNNIGCTSKEFFDSMHATNECFNKINFSK